MPNTNYPIIPPSNGRFLFQENPDPKKRQENPDPIFLRCLKIFDVSEASIILLSLIVNGIVDLVWIFLLYVE